jgi:hypothetical protein
LRYDANVDDRFWQGRGLPLNRILFGRLGEENANHPGTYRFSSSDGFVVNDAHILSPDIDVEGGGEVTKPRAGSYCVAAFTADGAQCFIIGFVRIPEVNEETDDPPEVGNPTDNNSAGDKVYRTTGGATMILKRGGAVLIEGGEGTAVIMNPVNNTMTLRSSNFGQVVDGYRASRGRKEIGGTKPNTVHEEAFIHQVGPSHDRVAIRHGDLEDGLRRELELASVTVVGGAETATIKTRETINADGEWTGYGPKYRWGGPAATEPAVLGNALVEVFGKLIDIIKALKVNTAWGPSTPPLPPTPIDLEKLRSELSDKILSTFAFFSKNPADL